MELLSSEHQGLDPWNAMSDYLVSSAEVSDDCKSMVIFLAIKPTPVFNVVPKAKKFFFPNSSKKNPK